MCMYWTIYTRIVQLLYHYSAVVKSFLNNEYGSYLHQRECPMSIYIILCVVFVPVRNTAGVSHTIVYVSTYYVDSIYLGRRWCHRNVNPDGVRLIIHYREPVVFIVRLQQSCTTGIC